MELENIKPQDIETIKINDSEWNCDKCIFFIESNCTCMAHKRFLFADTIGQDCDDGKYPFVLKNITEKGNISKPIIVDKICKDKRYGLISPILGQDDKNVYLRIVCKENPGGIKRIYNMGTISWEMFNEYFEIIN